MTRPHLAALLRELGFQPDDLRALADELEGAPAKSKTRRRVRRPTKPVVLGNPTEQEISEMESAMAKRFRRSDA